MAVRSSFEYVGSSNKLTIFFAKLDGEPSKTLGNQFSMEKRQAFFCKRLFYQLFLYLLAFNSFTE